MSDSENIIDAAVIENNVIVNVIAVTSLDFMENLVHIPEYMEVGIGWSYIDGQFVAPTESV
jgi:hypothetical protein